MKTGRNYKFWFCTDPRISTGDECLRHVADIPPSLWSI